VRCNGPVALAHHYPRYSKKCQNRRLHVGKHGILIAFDALNTLNAGPMNTFEASKSLDAGRSKE